MIGNQPVITTASVEAKRNFSREMNKLRRNQQILTILILLFICMLFWIIVSLFSSQRGSKIGSEINQLATPLTPTLNTDVLDSIDNKISYTEEELADFPINIIFTDSQTQTQRIVPLGTAILPVSQTTPARTATSGSQLQQVLETPTTLDTVDAETEVEP